MFGAEHFRNNDNWTRTTLKTKARIGMRVERAQVQVGGYIMPTYLKAKSPEDGWIRVVRKIMEDRKSVV